MASSKLLSRLKTTDVCLNWCSPTPKIVTDSTNLYLTKRRMLSGFQAEYLGQVDLRLTIRKCEGFFTKFETFPSMNKCGFHFQSTFNAMYWSDWPLGSWEGRDQLFGGHVSLITLINGWPFFGLAYGISINVHNKSWKTGLEYLQGYLTMELMRHARTGNRQSLMCWWNILEGARIELNRKGDVKMVPIRGELSLVAANVVPPQTWLIKSSV